ncbi:4Fe-4S binding protein [Thermophilibacter sp.]
MAVVRVVFSPTGGTQRVADAVAERLAERLGEPAPSSVDLADPAAEKAPAEGSLATLDASDLAVIAVPSYGGRVPKTASERLARVAGNGARAVLVCVYGNRAYEDTLVELEDVAKAAGFSPVAAVAAVAEHSIVREIAAGRPDDADLQELQGFADKIAERVSQLAPGEVPSAPSLPGNRPYKKAGGAGMVPKATRSCVNCGTCARLCPVQAIDPSDCRKVDAKRCISCMRCVSVCPHGARSVSKVMLAAAGAALKKACADRKGNELFLA